MYVCTFRLSEGIKLERCCSQWDKTRIADFVQNWHAWCVMYSHCLHQGQFGFAVLLCCAAKGGRLRGALWLWLWLIWCLSPRINIQLHTICRPHSGPSERERLKRGERERETEKCDGERDRSRDTERGKSRGWLDILANASVRKGQGMGRRKGGMQERGERDRNREIIKAWWRKERGKKSRKRWWKESERRRKTGREH